MASLITKRSREEYERDIDSEDRPGVKTSATYHDSMPGVFDTTYKDDFNIYGFDKHHSYADDKIQAARHALWLHHIDQATSSPPPLSTLGDAFKTLAWQGRGNFVITTVPDATRKSYIRISPQPWSLNRPMCSFVQNFTDAELATANGNLQNTDNSFLGNSGQGPTFTILAVERVDTRVTDHPYLNINPEDNGFTGTNVNLKRPGTIEQGETPGLEGTQRAYPFGQFMGGCLEITVLVPQGVTANCVAVGQKEVRGVGNQVLDESALELGGSLRSFVAAPDFHIERGAFVIGGLNAFKEQVTLVGNDMTQQHTFYIPIMPGQIGRWMQMNEANNGANGSNSIWMQPLSAILRGDEGGGFNIYNTATHRHRDKANQISTQFNPWFAFNNDENTSNAVIEASTAASYRIQRTVRNIGQCLLAGMPQFEIVVSASPSSSVTVNVNYKMFYNFVTNIEHPSFEAAFNSSVLGGVDGQLAKYQQVIGSHAGNGFTVAEAITSSKQRTEAAMPSHPETDSLIHSFLTNHGLSIAYPRPGIGEQIQHSDPNFGWHVLGGLRKIMEQSSTFQDRGKDYETQTGRYAIMNLHEAPKVPMKGGERYQPRKGEKIITKVKDAFGWLWQNKGTIGTVMQTAGQLAMKRGLPRVGLGLMGLGSVLGGRSSSTPMPKIPFVGGGLRAIESIPVVGPIIEEIFD